ncbi:MAG: DNA polymerase III subunit delta [Thermomicrobiales bacterium]
MIHLIYGPDHALARDTFTRLLDAADPSGDNISRFDAQSDGWSAVSAALSTPSFFGPPRVVVAEGFLAQFRQSTGGKTRRSRSTKSGGASDELADLVETARQHGVLIFYDPDLAAVPAAAKALLPDSALVTGHAPPRGTALIDFTRQAAADRGASIDRESARYLLSRLFPGHWNQAASNPAFDRPPDITLLLTELDKLALAAGPEGIDDSIIDELTAAGSTDRVFTLLDAIASGNAAAALRELRAFPNSADEHARIVAMVGQQVEYTAAATSPGRPRDPLQAGKLLGMSNPNRMKAILQNVGPSGGPTDLLESTIDADRRLKSGLDSSPTDAIYRIITSSRSKSDKRKSGE